MNKKIPLDFKVWCRTKRTVESYGGGQVRTTEYTSNFLVQRRRINPTGNLGKSEAKVFCENCGEITLEKREYLMINITSIEEWESLSKKLQLLINQKNQINKSEFFFIYLLLVVFWIPMLPAMINGVIDFLELNKYDSINFIYSYLEILYSLKTIFGILIIAAIVSIIKILDIRRNRRTMPCDNFYFGFAKDSPLIESLNLNLLNSEIIIYSLDSYDFQGKEVTKHVISAIDTDDISEQGIGDIGGYNNLKARLNTDNLIILNKGWLE